MDERLLHRIWSAGCSTGEEPYSIAMLLDGLLPERAAWDILIFATDMQKEFLDNAERGLYGQWSLRMTGGDVIRKYFTRHADGFELKEEIRNMVSFRQEGELKRNFNELERMNKLMVGRELTMEELREEVRALRKRLKELEAG